MVAKNKIKKLVRKRSCVFNLSYHIIWIPKYKRKILKDEIENTFKLLLAEKAKRMNINLKAVECMPDHVHLFVISNQTDSVSNIVKNLKGYTSYHLRKKFTSLSKLKCLWAPSYYCESIGHISENTIIKYINNQKNN